MNDTCRACGHTMVVGDQLDGLYGERLADECPQCGMTEDDCAREAADRLETERDLHRYANANIARELARQCRGAAATAPGVRHGDRSLHD